MAQAVKRLFGPAQLTAVAATKYTVPANTKTKITHLHATNPSGSAITFTLSIGADAAGTRIYDTFVIGAGQVLDQFCFYVLDAAEIVQALASVASVCVLTLDGIEYTLG